MSCSRRKIEDFLNLFLHFFLMSFAPEVGKVDDKEDEGPAAVRAVLFVARPWVSVSAAVPVAVARVSPPSHTET